MTSIQIFEKLAVFFNTRVETNNINIDSEGVGYPAIQRRITCKNTSRNLAICTGMQFTLLNFVPDPFRAFSSDGGVPRGYKAEEFAFSVPLPVHDNNSYDQNFIRRAYGSIEPSIRQTFPGYPIFLTNLFGKVYLCLMLNPNGLCFNNEISLSAIERIVSVLNEVKNYVERTYY